MPKTQPPSRPPKEYWFNRTHQEEFADQFWLCPIRLVTDGTWARLWRMEGTKRGGGVATSVLPVLAMHVFPGRGEDVERWTEWCYLSRRRIARLAGLDKSTVREGLRALEAEGLLELRYDLHPETERKGFRTKFRLSTRLYPQAGEEKVTFRATLIYGGTWSLLPTSSCRHLYVVLACLDPVRDPDVYQAVALSKLVARVRLKPAQYMAEQLEKDPELRKKEGDRILARRRAKAPRSLAELAGFSGMRRSTVAEALRVLLLPVPGRVGGKRGVPRMSVRKRKRMARREPLPVLVRKGKVRARKPTWYAPDPAAQRWAWPPSILNHQGLVDEIQRTWGRKRRLPPKLLWD